MIEQIADKFRAMKGPNDIKRARIKGIPRQAVLKPSHSLYRLQGQTFSLGDRVVMVADAAAGGVPLALKGVVIGIGARDIDVVWDVAFMGGETLSGRCSEYRGSTVAFTSCLNLTKPQFAIGQDSAPTTVGSAAPFKPRLGPQPVVQMQNYRPSTVARHNGVANGNGYSMPNPRGPTRAPMNGHTGMGFGDAVKGFRPPAQHAPVMRHKDKLQSVLLGQERLLAAQQQARGRSNGAAIPHQPVQHVAKSPTRHTVALPTSPKARRSSMSRSNPGDGRQVTDEANGHGGGAPMRARGRGRGRGGARGGDRGGRGRGRGQGIGATNGA